MNFRFLHAADLHLGSPFLGLAQKDDAVAARFASASRSAFEGLITQAIEEDVSFVVIAGDIFDGEWKDASIGLFFNRQLARLSNRNIPTYLLRGNHDAESVVARSLTWPEKVFEFSPRRPETHRIKDLRVALHGRGFPYREVRENYAVDYPEPVAGWFNIGVLHTACGRSGHENYAPCGVADLAARGYDYWALGHVHAYEIVSEDPWMVYPGNLQGRSVRECGERGAVIVDVTYGAVANVRRVVTDCARWAEVYVDASPHEDQTALLRAVETELRPHAAAAAGRLLAVRVVLTGATTSAFAIRRRPGASARRSRGGGAALRARTFGSNACASRQRSRGRQSATPRSRKLIWPPRSTIARRTPRCGGEWPIFSRRSRTSSPGGMAEDASAALDLDSILAEARALALGRSAGGLTRRAASQPRTGEVRRVRGPADCVPA